MILHTNVRKLAPCVLPGHPVVKINPKLWYIQELVSKWEMLWEQFNSQSERRASLSVEKSMPKL